MFDQFIHLIIQKIDFSRFLSSNFNSHDLKNHEQYIQNKNVQLASNFHIRPVVVRFGINLMPFWFAKRYHNCQNRAQDAPRCSQDAPGTLQAPRDTLQTTKKSSRGPIRPPDHPPVAQFPLAARMRCRFLCHAAGRARAWLASIRRSVRSPSVHSLLYRPCLHM